MTTLLIIAMAGILTVGIARNSMNLAVASLEAEQDLQDRWGAISCQRIGFSEGARMVRLSSEISDRPTKDSTCEILLNRQWFQVRFEDESAKLDVNTLFENTNRKNAISVIRKFQPNRSLTIKLSPLRESQRRKPTEDAFEAWGQVFVASNGNHDYPAAIRQLSQHLTCWSRRLNYQNCSDRALFESTKPAVGSIIANQLVNNRKRGARSAQLAIEQTQATGQQQTRLKEMLSDSSTAKSVWISSVSRTRQRHFFTVRESVTGTLSRYYSWSW